MATVMELREKRASLWEGAKAFLESHRDNDGKLSAEDAAAYDKMEADVVALGKEIERMERQAAIDAELAKPTAEPIVNTPKAAVPEKTGRASDAYAEDFGRHLRGRGLVHNVLSEGTDADGGYLVPEEFERQIVTTLDEANVIRSLAKVITTSSERKIPVASSHSVAQWTPENGNYQESNPTFEQKQIDAYKLTDLKLSTTKFFKRVAENFGQKVAKAGREHGQGSSIHFRQQGYGGNLWASEKPAKLAEVPGKHPSAGSEPSRTAQRSGTVGSRDSIPVYHKGKVVDIAFHSKTAYLRECEGVGGG